MVAILFGYYLLLLILFSYLWLPPPRWLLFVSGWHQTSQHTLLHFWLCFCAVIQHKNVKIQWQSENYKTVSFLFFSLLMGPCPVFSPVSLIASSFSLLCGLLYTRTFVYTHTHVHLFAHTHTHTHTHTYTHTCLHCRWIHIHWRMFFLSFWDRVAF